MFDPGSPKLLIPALLFAVLSPRPTTDLQTTLIRAAMLVIVYWILAKVLARVSLTKADLIVPAALFVLLTPGILLTVSQNGVKFGRTGLTSGSAIVIHTIVFTLAFAALRSNFPPYY